MYKKALPLFIHVQTPLHVGTGSDVGTVDQPIQREKHTAYPKIESSGIKGCIRDVFEEIKGKEINGFGKVDENDINLLFGPEETGDKGYAAALGFSDARLLLFPVKSVKGVFAWITCPHVLKRLKKDLEICSAFNQPADHGPLAEKFFQNVKSVPPAKSAANLDKIKVADRQVIFEEYAFEVNEQTETKEFAEKLSKVLENEDIKDKLVVLPDDIFKDFVQLFTELITRTRIGSSGTVEPGALFTEEYLPAESILYSLVLVSPAFAEEEKKGRLKGESQVQEVKNITGFFTKNLPEYLQIGGNATLGKGIVKVVAFENGCK